MGSWGITMRESDYGLDLLGTIVNRQLKALDFSTFKQQGQAACSINAIPRMIYSTQGMATLLPWALYLEESDAPGRSV